MSDHVDSSSQNIELPLNLAMQQAATASASSVMQPKDTQPSLFLAAMLETPLARPGLLAQFQQSD